jgi:quercetin dioxygenase-like cupin family protein
VKVVNVKELEPRMLSKGSRVWRFGLAILGSDKLQLSLAEFDPGCQEHIWTFEGIDEIMYVLKGSLRLCWGNEEVELKKGDVVFLPPGIEFRERNIGTEKTIVIAALAPPLE